MVFVEIKLLIILKLKDDTKKNVSELQKREKLSLNYKNFTFKQSTDFSFYDLLLA